MIINKYLQFHIKKLKEDINLLNYNDINEDKSNIIKTTNLNNSYISYISVDQNIIYVIDSSYNNRYINDLIMNYNNKNFAFINNMNKLKLISFNKSNIILINNLLNTNINIDDIISINYNNAIIIITIYDFSWIDNIKDNIKNLFLLAKYIIHPTKFSYEIYSKYFDNSNFIVLNNPDININIKNSIIYLPIINNTINIFILNKLDENNIILNLINIYHINHI
jgi:hypothetical protein